MVHFDSLIQEPEAPDENLSLCERMRAEEEWLSEALSRLLPYLPIFGYMDKLSYAQYERLRDILHEARERIEELEGAKQ